MAQLTVYYFILRVQWLKLTRTMFSYRHISVFTCSRSSVDYNLVTSRPATENCRSNRTDVAGIHTDRLWSKAHTTTASGHCGGRGQARDWTILQHHHTHSSTRTPNVSPSRRLNIRKRDSKYVDAWLLFSSNTITRTPPLTHWVFSQLAVNCEAGLHVAKFHAIDY